MAGFDMTYAPSQAIRQTNPCHPQHDPCGISSPRREWWTNHTARWAFPALRSFVVHTSACLYIYVQYMPCQVPIRVNKATAVA